MPRQRRYAPYARKPRCPHVAAAWAEYDAKVAACYDRTDAWGPSPTDKPDAPEEDGYCEDCRRALQQPGAVWPAEVWAYLNTQAANDYCPGPRSKPYKIPPYIGPRRLTGDKWLQQAVTAYGLTPKNEDPTCRAIYGRYVGDDERGRPYVVSCTNGHTALLQPGSKPADARPIPYMLPAATPTWIDLPPDFHAALRRVRLFANERSGAIRLAIGEFGRLILKASSPEIGEASEWIAIEAHGELPDFETCLAADYLDPLCGCWPVRWYLRPPVEKQDSPSRWNPNPQPYFEDRPQLFSPHGTDARVLIMPMRI